MKFKQANGANYELIAFKQLSEFGTYAIVRNLNEEAAEPYVVVADLELDEDNEYKGSWAWGHYYSSLDSARDAYDDKN